jgi:hypothetical protein
MHAALSQSWLRLMLSKNERIGFEACDVDMSFLSGIVLSGFLSAMARARAILVTGHLLHLRQRQRPDQGWIEVMQGVFIYIASHSTILNVVLMYWLLLSQNCSVRNRGIVDNIYSQNSLSI